MTKQSIYNGLNMKFYPINLNIEGKRCVVIGGGKVAERKVSSILFCGGKVQVISPELTSELAKMAKQGEIDYIKSEYKPGFLKGAYIAYATTSNREVNSRVSRDGEKKGLPVNVCDSVKESAFILPAVLRRKGVTIAVSSEGKSPQEAVMVRDKLKKLI